MKLGDTVEMKWIWEELREEWRVNMIKNTLSECLKVSKN